MSLEDVQRVIAMAVMDIKFRWAPLETPTTALETFGLSPDEYARLSSIQAGTLEEFAEEVDRLIAEQDTTRNNGTNGGPSSLWQSGTR